MKIKINEISKTANIFGRILQAEYTYPVLQFPDKVLYNRNECQGNNTIFGIWNFWPQCQNVFVLHNWM